MSYIKTLTKEQLENIQTIKKLSVERGITNLISVAALLSVVSKESAFIPKYEIGYKNTSNSRLREIFPSSLKKLTEVELTNLKSNDEKFFNFMYGGRFGNSITEGYKYRGAGLNQTTFKGNYINLKKLTGIDFENNPDLINILENATIAVVEDFKDRFKNSTKTVLTRYWAKDINDFKTLQIAAQAFYNANAGFGKNTINSKMDGYKRTLDRVQEIYNYINK